MVEWNGRSWMVWGKEEGGEWKMEDGAWMVEGGGVWRASGPVIFVVIKESLIPSKRGSAPITNFR